MSTVNPNAGRYIDIGMYTPPQQDKTYTHDDVINVFNLADTNNDNHLTSTELNTFKNIAYFRYDPANDKNKEIATILSNNYASIAYRALKPGEITTQEMRTDDGTIEQNELNKLMSFDGDDNNLTKTDVSLLRNGRTSNWPQTTGTSGGGGTGNNGQIKKLLLLLIVLLFSGGFGGAQQSGGGLLGNTNNNTGINFGNLLGGLFGRQQ